MARKTRKMPITNASVATKKAEPSKKSRRMSKTKKSCQLNFAFETAPIIYINDNSFRNETILPA